MTYNYDKISACLRILEEIQVSGTDNMLNILFLNQNLQHPVQEEQENGSDSP